MINRCESYKKYTARIIGFLLLGYGFYTKEAIQDYDYLSYAAYILAITTAIMMILDFNGNDCILVEKIAWLSVFFFIVVKCFSFIYSHTYLHFPF
jgi:hypothetical protein